MKLTITLTEAEVKGIKTYLKEVNYIDKPSKQDVKIFIDGVIQSIHSPSEAVSDYIQQFEKNIKTQLL